MIEFKILASGSSKRVLTGKHYSRCVRAHKLVFEVMQRLTFLAFYESRVLSMLVCSIILTKLLVFRMERGVNFILS